MHADVVFVGGLRLSCKVGVEASEREVARRLYLDLEVALDCRPAALAEDVSFTVDYARLAHLAQGVAARREYVVLETVAEDLCAAVFETFPQVTGVRVRLGKRGVVAGAQEAGVMIERKRETNP